MYSQRALLCISSGTFHWAPKRLLPTNIATYLECAGHLNCWLYRYCWLVEGLVDVGILRMMARSSAHALLSYFRKPLRMLALHLAILGGLFLPSQCQAELLEWNKARG